MAAAITVLESKEPPILGKRYRRDVSGRVTKTAVASVISGIGSTRSIGTLAELAELLTSVSESTSACIVPGTWRGVNGHFRVVPERDLIRMAGRADVNTPVCDTDGQLVVARLKRMIEPSAFLLIDCDDSVGMPAEWVGLPIAERLRMLEPVIPGISTCERIELRGSSARVVAPGDQPGERSHAWVRVTHPQNIELMREHARIETVVQKLSFGAPIYARGTGEQIGEVQRTLIDLAVWVTGRIVFNAKPVLDVSMHGFKVSDAGIQIVNRGGGDLDTSRYVAPPKPERISKYMACTRSRIDYTRDGTSLVLVEHGLLRWDTPIVARGVTRTLRDWVQRMHVGEKKRCETPFRQSESEAAYIRRLPSGPFLFDSGTQTKYLVAAERMISLQQVIEADLETVAGRALVNDYRRQELLQFNDRYGLALIEGASVVVTRRPAAAGVGFQTEFIRLQSLKDMYANRNLPFAQGTGDAFALVWKPIVGIWLKWRARRSYTGIAFDPAVDRIASDMLPPTEGDSRTPYQLYTGTVLDPASGNCDLILAHIREVWCADNADHYDYVIKWLARAVQRPQDPGQTALVLKSEQGAGKGVILEIFHRYFGQHFRVLNKPSDLSGFNDHLASSCLLNLNEATWGGDHDLTGVLKALITDDLLGTERKFMPKIWTRNRVSLIVTSNAEWIVPVERSDRRYFVLTCTESHSGDRAYFDALVHQRDHGGDAAFIDYLLNVDLTGFEVRDMPLVASEARLSMKLRTEGPVVSWWYQVLQDGGFTVRDDDAGTSATVAPRFIEWGESGCTVNRLRAYESFRQAAGHAGGHVSQVAFGRTMALMLGVERVQVHRPNRQPRSHLLPPLSQARDSFDRFLKQKVDWSYR